MIAPQRRAVAVRPAPGSGRARRCRRTCRGRATAAGLTHHAVAVPHERICGMVACHRCDLVKVAGFALQAAAAETERVAAKVQEGQTSH